MEKEKIVHFVKGGPNADKVIRYNFQESMEALSGWVLREHKPALALKDVADERVSETVFQRRQELDVGSTIVVPVQYQEQIKGTLTAINGLDAPNFNEQDVELMMALGNQAALALENVRLYEAEQHRAQELQAQNEELDAFAHTVAHDLKSPLSNLMGFVDLLVSEEGVDETVRMYGGYIFKSGQKMVNIIDELLLLAQVRQADVKPVPLDMERIVKESRKRLRHHFDDYKAELIVPEEWPIVLGYSTWVEEIWVNYMSNAMKYGGRPPRVELRYVQLPNNFVKFQVVDNGAGLSPEAKNSLFTPFERLEQVGKIEGYGLGLSIVRRIAEKLGGKVGVESEPGQGSAFFFTLPLA
jgi:signal transduction histidine kinase